MLLHLLEASERAELRSRAQTLGAGYRSRGSRTFLEVVGVGDCRARWNCGQNFQIEVAAEFVRSSERRVHAIGSISCPRTCDCRRKESANQQPAEVQCRNRR